MQPFARLAHLHAEQRLRQRALETGRTVAELLVEEEALARLEEERLRQDEIASLLKKVEEKIDRAVEHRLIPALEEVLRSRALQLVPSGEMSESVAVPESPRRRMTPISDLAGVISEVTQAMSRM